MKPMSQEPSSMSMGMKKKMPPVPMKAVVAILAVLVFGAALWAWNARAEKYQAVFLDNNQVYFGKLRYGWLKTARLDDVFYLRVTQALQPQGEPQPDLQLVQLGGELHGPESTMHIPKSQILFWENLKKDSQVTKAIENFKSQNKK